MPALFSLGQRAAFRTMQQHLLPNEALLAFLDDVYVVVPPNRVRPVYDTLAHTLQSQASIQLNQGKTRAWNAAGIEPPNIRDLGEDVWVGNPNLPARSQGMTVLGAPIGSAAFVQHQLQQANQQHQHLLDRIPHLEDLYRLPGCCCSTAPVLGVPISYACVRPTSPPTLPTTTTSRSQLASAASSQSMTSPPRL